MHRLKRILFAVLLVVLSLIILLSLPYYRTKIYHFEKSQAFSGSQFYNPYLNASDSWLKANFHAHSKLFLGLTNGENTEEEMKKKYDSLNFDLACLSNYNTISSSEQDNSFFSVYEHGLNMGFRHQLVFNSTEADFFDFPIWQNLSQKQTIIDQLKTEENLIALAHPSFMWGYEVSDYPFLRNYDLMEVVSVRKKSLNHWDAALSAGQVVWGIGNDDSHDTLDSHCGLVWNMINTRYLESDTVLEKLREGSSYFVKGWQGIDMLELKALKVVNDTFKLVLNAKADSITLISDNGEIVKIATNSNSISYKIKEENTYVRAEAFISRPWNTYTKMYFNPVIKTKDGQIRKKMVELEIDKTGTFLYFLRLVIIDLLAIALIIFTLKKLKTN